jgi:hypothetical protein
MPFTDKSLRRIALGCAVLSVAMLSQVAAQGIQPADATELHSGKTCCTA